MKKHYLVLTSVLFFVISLASISSSFAQTNTSTGNLWATGANWSLGHVPSAAEDVVINSNMALNLNTATVKSLTVNDGRTFTMGNSGTNRTLNVTNDVTINGPTGAIRVSANAATHALTIGGAISNSGIIDLWNSASQVCNVTMNGNSISGSGSFTFNNLTIGNVVANSSPSTITMMGNLVLNNTLTCSDGAFSFAKGATAQTISGTVNPTFNDVSVATNTTAVTVSGISTMTLNGGFTMNNTSTFTLSGVTTAMTVNGNFTMNNSSTFDFGTTSARTVTVNGDFTPKTVTMSGAGLAHQLILKGANNNNPTAFTTTLASGSVVEYGAAGDQTIFGSTGYQNIKITNGGTKTLNGHVTMSTSGVLTLTSGIVELNNYNLTISNTGAAAITGGTFSETKMISTDGTGFLIKSCTSAQTLNPIGAGGYYSPMTLSSITPTAGTYSIRAVPIALNPAYINVYWDFQSSAGKTITATFQYDPGQQNGATQVIAYTPAPYTVVQRPPSSGTSSFGTNSFTITGNTTATIGGYWSMGSATYYSYQTGNWDVSTTWTSDPSGSLQVGATIPGANDNVVILTGRTVTLAADVTTPIGSLAIDNSAFLDMSTNRFTGTLTLLSGQGTLRLASVNFPTITTNTFINAGGGTVEYYNAASFNLPAAQTTYNNLTINTSGQIATQLMNLTLNGDLLVKSGTFRINDGTTAKRQLTVGGNVTVNSGGSISVGNGVTNTTTNPIGITTTAAAPFIEYYDNQSHRVVINGDFVNNGTVNFNNLPYPVYNAFPPTTAGATTGFATVYFRGSSNNVLTCNGVTNFYNLVLDKGTDQTFSLTVTSSAYPNFRLNGANTAPADITNATATNPNVKKALWIRNGTMILQGSTVIPSLSEGNTTAALPGTSDFYIPANGALNISGADVVVLGTADDYREVNAAYSVSGGTGTANGVIVGGYSSIYVYGKLQVADGYLSTRESGGITTNGGSGQVVINNGVIDAKQFLNSTSSTGAFQMTGGTFSLRGRFKRVPASYAAVANLADNTTTTINTVRAANGVTTGVGSFNLNNTGNIFNMSGGNIVIYDVVDVAGQYAFDVKSAAAGISVTGGTVTIAPMTGTATADAANYLISSTASLANLVVNRTSSTSMAELATSYPLTVLSNVDIQAGTLDANAQNLTIGGNFTIANGATYVASGASANTTTFNGSAAQTFTVNTAAALDLNNLTLTKTAGIAVNFAGSQTTINLAGALNLTLGTLNDNGNSIFVKGNVYNSGVHSGAGKISLNGTAVQSIDGNGTFQNLELNNTNAATSPVSLLAATTINGTLTLSQDKLFNIGAYNLKFNGSATVVNASANRYIQSAGAAGDGGITKVYTSPAAFVFPLGAASTQHAAANYTPASIGLSAAPTAYGSITVVPVGYAHPNETTANQSLTYFWRVSSSGFTLGTATVTHGYTYSVNDLVVNGTTITENGYVAARYNLVTASWTRGTTSDLDIAAGKKIIGQPTPGTFLKNVAFIDGDYTAGDDTPTNPFGTPKVFYSYTSGVWYSAASWTGDPTRATYQNIGTPSASDIVHIGAGHTISAGTPANYQTTLNTDRLYCATLYIDANSVLDNRYNPGSNFGIVMNSPLGNGKIKITTSFTSGSTFANPAGDFSSFNTNLGTTELYSTNPATNTTYWMANGITTYGNLLITPQGLSNIIFANNDVLIYGNLTATGTSGGSWLCPTWVGNYPGSIPQVASKTITINGNMDIQGGSFGWYNNGTNAANVVVKGDVIVCTACALGIFSTATNQSLTIGGSLINNGNGDATSGGIIGVNLTNVPTTFNGNTSASVTNTTGTPNTVFGKVTVNKGTSQATTLNINIGGTFTTPTDNWLTLQNGTLQYQRTNPATDFTISQGNNLSIPATAGLYINYANSSNRNVLISNSSNDAADLLLSGKLTVVSGNVYVGPTSFPAFNNDIEYTGNTAAIQVDGGNLYVNGQIRRSTASTNGALTYTQSAGAVLINGQTGGAATSQTRAKLEVLNTGSQFNMSGGTITIVRGGGTTFGDLYIRPTSSTVTGGTVTFTNATPNTLQGYTMDASASLYNLTITGAAAQNATVTLMTNPLTLKGSLTLSNARSLFVANNRNVTINQNLVNNASTAAYAYGTNTTTFSGSSQNISGSAVTNFYDLVVAPSLSLTVNNSFTVNRNLTITSGTLQLSSYKATVSTTGDFVNNGAYSDDNVTGGVSMNGTSKQSISGTGSFQRLEINNASGAQLLNDITLDHNLVMTNGVFDIKSNNLILNTTSNIIGAPYSVTKMITTDGVATALGLSKFFPSIASTTTFTYPVGSASKYTPAVLTINSNAAIGYIKVAPVNSYQPTVNDPTRVLDYYYSIASSGISGFSGAFVLNYSGADVNGSEPDYVAGWLQLPGTYWSKSAVGSGTDNVNEFTHQITFNYPAGTSNLNGDYTAGEDDAIPNQIPTYVSNKNGNWSDNTIWTPVGTSPPCPVGGPNGYNVIIRHTVSTTVNNCFSYTTVIEGTGKLSILTPTYGHNFGTVDGDPALGAGTVFMQGANLPAGNFQPFLDCGSTGTLEYGGTGTYTMVLNGFTSIPNLTLSGTGTRVLPDDDLTICNVLKIDGPTLDNSVSNRKLTINGSMERYNTGAFTAGSGSNATVSFSGTAAQSVGGATGNFSGTNAFYNLEVNNAAGLTIGASGTIEVNGVMSLTNGIVTTSTSNTLSLLNTLSTAVVPSGGSSTSFVNGPLKKQMLNGGSFVYPLGQGAVKGHTFTLTSTTAGSSLFTAQYFTPNPTYASVTAPIVDVNTAEFWGVSTTASKTAKVDIAWDAQSDINGAMTANGISDLRVVEYNTGTSSWVAQASTASGTTTLGDVQTTGNVSVSTTAKNYSIGSITTTKPIAVLTPSGAVCGTAGIPVTFTIHSPITLNYTLTYKFNGVVQTPVVVTALPYTLPTPSPGTYELTGFLYNNSTLTGVVDNSVITAYPAPTVSAAGADQSICNATSLNLGGNQPTVGTGLWTVVSGTGGWFNTPDASNYNALFGGPPGRTYTLRWTITSGACTSTDDVVISFPYSPQQPTGFTAAPTSVCQGSTGYVYTVPAVTGASSYVWTYSGTGATFVGSGNSITVNFSATATSGNIGVAAVNGCGTGTARTVAVTVVPPTVATFSYAGSPYCPSAPNPSPTFSGGGVAGTFSSTSGLVFVSTATGQVNIAGSTPGTYTVTNTIPAISPCGIVTATATITIQQIGNWAGTVSGNWSDPNNWVCSTIPTTAIDVIVPASAPNMPVVNAAGAVCKSVTINSGATLTISGTNTLNIYGGWSSAGTFTANSGTVVFNTSGTVGGASTTTFNNVTIAAGVTLTSSSTNVNVSGNWTNNGTFTPGTGTVTFNGTTSSTLTGSTSFYNLTMSKTGANATLSGTATTTVTNALTLTSGSIVSSATHKVALTAAATTSGASAASYVSGPMTKVLTGPTFTFPVGSVSKAVYRPAVISNTSGADTWTAEYVGADPTSGGYDHNVFNATYIGKISMFEYWLISRAGATSADLTLSYDAGSYLGTNIGNVANLMVARWNGTAWDLPPGGGSFSQSGTNVTGTTKVTNVTSFSPFTHASKELTSPLPIKLLYFKATAQSASVLTEWATSQEIDNEYFTVEKSADGETFKEVAKVQARGDGTSNQKYSTQDYDPYPGLSYYRLKQTDLDGKYTYSKVVAVTYEGNGGVAFSTYPNPFAGRKITLEIKGLSSNTDLPVQIIDLMGRTLLEKVVTTNNSGAVKEEIVFDRDLPAGVYIIKAGPSLRFTHKIEVN